jgi:hypothetical protein
MGFVCVLNVASSECRRSLALWIGRELYRDLPVIEDFRERPDPKYIIWGRFLSRSRKWDSTAGSWQDSRQGFVLRDVGVKRVNAGRAAMGHDGKALMVKEDLTASAEMGGEGLRTIKEHKEVA